MFSCGLPASGYAVLKDDGLSRFGIAIGYGLKRMLTMESDVVELRSSKRGDSTRGTFVNSCEGVESRGYTHGRHRHKVVSCLY